ncbi:MAG: hypothetical protein II988_02985 [Clostridia bacterium]|nr:hypothetical protein [Clostridia bacterium]
MATALEAVMLICFGLSWPVALLKNLKASSYKNINIWFILLITLGYIAGTSAKIIKGDFSYVFYIYIFNLIVVSCNIFVYFVKLLKEKRN